MAKSSPTWARIRRGITWVLLASVSVAGAVAAALTPQGQARFAQLFLQPMDVTWPTTTDSKNGRPDAAAITQNGNATDMARRLSAIEAAIERLDKQDKAVRAEVRDLAVVLAGAREQLGQITGSVATPETATVVVRKTPPSTAPSSGSIAVRVIPIGPEGIPSSQRADDTTQPPMLTPMVNLAMPAQEQAALTGAPKPVPVPTVMITDFGIELARAATIDDLETEWKRLSASQKGGFAGLEPRISLDFSSTDTAKLVLIAGPIRNARDAARLCAMLSAAGESCRTVPFGEDTVALNAPR